MSLEQSRLWKAQQAIARADAILIGGGAGLSDAAGLHYTGKRFTDNFAPFIQKYGFTDLYTSSFYPFETQEARWGYWTQHIAVNRYDQPATALYEALLDLVDGKDCFAVTTNVEHQFVKAGFPAAQVFAVQGDYGFLQCAVGCHDVLYDNEALVRDMVVHTQDCRIPSDLVPKCPLCGGEMDVNLRHNQHFVEDEAWRQMAQRYQQFLARTQGKRVVYLELGVGYNTPGIIRFPFEQMTSQNEQATLIRLNRDHPEGAQQNAARTLSFAEDMAGVVAALGDKPQASLVAIDPKMDGVSP